jgi:hypothetical protein
MDVEDFFVECAGSACVAEAELQHSIKAIEQESGSAEARCNELLWSRRSRLSERRY